MVFFWDEGQAFDRFSEVGIGIICRFQKSAGFGLHVVESRGILQNLKLHFEETRIMFSCSGL